MSYESFLRELYEGGRKVLEGASRHAVAFKSVNDLLTEADLSLNAYFVSEISKAYPEAAIIAEESDNDLLSSRLTFVVDPLDGTCNFARGIPLHGIQIAVFENGVCVESLIGLPQFNRVYHARLGEGATVNGEPLRIDSQVPSCEGVLSLSDFYHEEKDISFENQFRLVSSLQGDFLKTRLFGAACVDFTYLAEGLSQAYLCFYRHIWDIAPGLLIAKEAGAKHARLTGEPYEYLDESLVVANNEETLDLILGKAKGLLK